MDNFTYQPAQTVRAADLGVRGGLLFSGFFKTFFEQHFQSPESIFDPALAALIWKKTDDIHGVTDTKLFIGSKITPKPKAASFRPAILVQRGAWQREKFALSDTYGMGGTGPGVPKVERWNGSHSFDCLSSSLATTEALATELATVLSIYREIVMSHLCICDLQVVSIGAPVIIEGEYDTTYSVTVVVSYTLSNSWIVEIEQLPIRRFFIDFGIKASADQFYDNSFKQ